MVGHYHRKVEGKSPQRNHDNCLWQLWSRLAKRFRPHSRLKAASKAFTAELFKSAFKDEIYDKSFFPWLRKYFRPPGFWLIGYDAWWNFQHMFPSLKTAQYEKKEINSIKLWFGFMKQISINLVNQFVAMENFKNSCFEGLICIDWDEASFVICFCHLSVSRRLHKLGMTLGPLSSL